MGDDTPEGRLHPEGAPGIMRALLGDQAYEANAANAKARAIRYQTVTAAITLAVVFGFAVVIPLAIAMWRWAL